MTNASRPAKIVQQRRCLTHFYPLSTNHYPLGGFNSFPFKSLPIRHWRLRTCPDDLANPLILSNLGELETRNWKLETDSRLAAIIVDSHTRRQTPVADAEIGIIGGSGLYSMPGLTGVHEVSLQTPFGAPSEAYVLGTLAGRKVAFLARHGRGHRFMPTELNYRANIHGMKQLGVERVISLSA